MKIIFIIFAVLFFIGVLLFFMSVVNAGWSKSVKTAYIGMGLMTFSWMIIIGMVIDILIDRYLL